MMEHEKISFRVDDQLLLGDLYRPAGAGEQRPALVMTGPYTGVKEQVTGTYAQRLAAKGFVTLAFDHRNFGESEGHVRQHEEPHKKIDDLGAATAFLTRRSEVDPKRLGAVGICLGGSYALRFAGLDPRIKALATVAAAYIGFPPESEEAAANKTDWLAGFADGLNALGAGAPEYIDAVSDNPQTAAGMPGMEPFEYYGTKRSYSPHWENRITRVSSYNLACFDAISAARHLQHTPSLVVHGTTDAFCSPENAQRAYDLISGEKRLEWIETSNHIELYDSAAHVSKAVEALARWFGDKLN